MAIVEVRGLTKAYGRRPPALRDVTLEVGEGVTGLLGPNGAGKSTLLQCILGLLPDFEGEVRVLGLDARRDRREVRRRVGFMPEVDTWLPALSGVGAVRFLGELSGLPYAEALRRAHDVLLHVGLGEAIYRPLAEYSTGMRQRFKLAQALVHDPQVLFLDEPTAGMDPEGRDEMLGLLHALAHEGGKHVVWSSHILPEVERSADAVVVLHQGRCLGAFRIEDLRARDGAFTLEAEGEVERFEALLAAQGIPAEPEARASDGAAAFGVPRRRTWTVRVPAGSDAGDLLALAREAGARVRRVVPRGEDLERVFHRLLEEPR